MKTLRVLVIFLAILIAAVLGFIYSGLYDVAASSPDEGLIGWALETTQERSIHRRAEEIQPPPLDDPAMIRTGLIHYHEMCTVCHGAPGIKISETGQGLNPTPPELAGEAGHEKAGEMFWDSGPESHAAGAGWRSRARKGGRDVLGGQERHQDDR